mgnify:CR=1 FL=1
MLRIRRHWAWTQKSSPKSARDRLREEGKLDAAPVFTDVKTFPYRKFRGQVDILSGGFPCQPFSAAGKRQATEDPRHLFPYIAEGIRECQPRIVFLENVAGIISAKTGDGESVLKYVLRELEGLGYQATAGIFSAEEVGAPHQRKRVFIMAYCNSVRHNGRELSDRDSGWSLPKQTQPRTEQPLVRSEVEGCSGDSREELGNASDLRCQQPSADSRETGADQSGKERGMYEPKGASSLSRYGSQPQGSPELANSIGTGLEGHSGNEQGEGRQSVRQGRPTTASGLSPRWPARPGEPQYEWEEPRVVADTKSQQGSPRDNRGEPRASSQSEQSQSGGGHSGSLRESNGQAESQLGRTSNGSTSRVDRLRLLGNGVVPATAAKAFVTLIQRLT